MVLFHKLCLVDEHTVHVIFKIFLDKSLQYVCVFTDDLSFAFNADSRPDGASSVFFTIHPRCHHENVPAALLIIICNLYELNAFSGIHRTISEKKLCHTVPPTLFLKISHEHHIVPFILYAAELHIPKDVIICRAVKFKAELRTFDDVIYYITRKKFTGAHSRNSRRIH